MCCIMLRRVVLLYWCCVVAVLCYAVVCCAVVWCAVLCSTLRCAALCCAAVLRCAELCCADLCCAVLGCAAPASSFLLPSFLLSLLFQLSVHALVCCSAAVWYFSLLAAAALGASASAGLVVPCWKFWSLAVACFNNFQKCSRFPFLAKTGFFSGSWRRFFSSLFSASSFDGFFLDFRRVLEAKIAPKTSFWSVFCDAFLEGILESIFLCFF